MTLLLLRTLTGTPPDIRVFVSANAQWAVGQISETASAIFHIDPINRVLLGTTFCAITAPFGVSNSGVAFGNGDTGNAAMATHTGTFAYLPQPGTGVFPQIAQMVGVSSDGAIPFAQLFHYNHDVSAISGATGWWTDPFPPGTDIYHGYPALNGITVPAVASLNGLFIAGSGSESGNSIWVLDRTTNVETILESSTDYLFIACISDDGSTQGGAVGAIGITQQAAYWDATHTRQTIGLPPGATQSVAIGVNADGTDFVVWSNNGIQRWTASDGFAPTGVFGGFTLPLSAFLPLSRLVSSDGSFITEFSYVDASNTASGTGMYNENIAYNFTACVGSDHNPNDPPILHPSYFMFFPDTNPNKDVNITGVHATAEIGQPFLKRFYLTMTELDIIQPMVNDGNRDVTLRYSDDAGANWSDPLNQSIGAIGEYVTDVQWRRIGMSRNRIIELSWSSEFATALTGAMIEFTIAGT